jgi:adenylate cyclase
VKHPPETAPLVRLPASRPRWHVIAAGVGFTALVIAFLWHPPRTLENLDGRVYDIFLRTAPHRPPGPVPVVVDIDEESLARYGQWPWPRYRVAQLLERVRDLGAAAVALDIVFAEPDRTSLTLIAREIERDLGVPVSIGEPAGRVADNDRRLAEVLEKGPFVLGYAFDFGSGSGNQPDACVLHPLELSPAKRDDGGGVKLARPSHVVCNLPQLARAAGASGFFNVAPDLDGTVRSVPLLIEYRGQVYPSLTLAALVRARGEAPVSLGADGGAARILRVAGREIPIDGSGNMLVRFRGVGRGYTYLSAAAVLEGRAPAGALTGHIAVVGTTAAGLKELRATPFDPVFPGPEVHAAALDTILQGDFLQRPRSAHGWELLAAFLAGTLATIVLSRSGAIAAGLPLLVFGSAALWGGSYWLFSQQGLFISPLIPQYVLAGTFALLSFLRFRQSEREAAEFSRKLSLTQDVIIQSMAALAETRDNETGGHIQRTRHYVKILAERLRNHPRFRDFLDDQTIELLYKLAPMHDIGKVGVRDHVLLKPERLTVAEYEEMKRHTTYGDDTLELAERHLGDSSFLRIAREFALTHQERWDGGGYPQGLKGDQIPIAGRLMAVADVYDALVSRRIYKEPQTHEQAAAALAQGRGTHFDPDVTDAFLEHQDQFKAIAARFADSSGRGSTAMETAAIRGGL